MGGLEASSFGDVLRQQRTERGWTQEELATRAGLSVEAIGALERGLRGQPRRATVQLLARALELDDADLLWFEAAAQRAPREPAAGRGQSPEGRAGMEPRVRTILAAAVRGNLRRSVEQGSVAGTKRAAMFTGLLRSGVAARGGRLIDLDDGAALADFASPRQGLRAATDLQTRCARMSIADPECSLSVGIGVETGPVRRISGGYRGTAVAVATRLCTLAGPDEILTTEGVIRVAGALADFDYVDRGFAHLSGIAEPARLFEPRRCSVPPVPGATAEREAETESPTLPAMRLPIGGFLGALPAGPIVGRGDEVRRLLTMVDVVAGGTGQLVLLSGEAGVGKSRLAQEINLQVRNRGFLAASGRCYEPQQATPFYPIVQALTSLFAAAPASVRAQAGRRWPYLSQLLPDDGRTFPPATAGPDDEQLVYYAVAGFLRAVARATPVALLLDDLHWADASSLALLQHLSRDTRGDRVLLLGTYRDVEVSHQHALKATVRDLNRERLISGVDVTRLDVSATSALIAALLGKESVSSEFVQLVHRRTEGNPYFVEHLLLALIERGDLFRREGNWDRRSVEEIQVPASVRSVIEQRINRLSPEAQATLRETSVLGQTFNFDDLAAVHGRQERELDDSLEEAIFMGLVRVTAQDDYSFDHALTQQTLYDELSPRRRRNLHLAAAAALEALPEHRRQRRVAELAWHYVQGNDLTKAIPWTMLAGDQAEAVCSHREAALRYQAVLDLADQVRDGSVRAEALEKLGRVYRLSARYDEALPALEQAVDCYRRQGHRAGEGRSIAQIGRAYLDQGQIEEGSRRVGALLEALAGDESVAGIDGVVAELEVVMAHLLWRGGAYQESARVAARAAARAQRAGSTGVRAEAEFRRGTALSHAGDFQQGFRAMEEAITLAESVGDLGTMSYAMGNLALFYWDRGEVSKARTGMVATLEVCRRSNDPSKIADRLGDIACVDFAQGNWESARLHLQEVEESLGGVAVSWIRAHNTLRLGELCLAEGQKDEGLRLVVAARDLAEHDGNVLAECEAAYVLSDHSLFTGKAEPARNYLQHFFDRHSADPAAESLQTWSLALFARLFAEMGDLDRADDFLNRIADTRVIALLDTVPAVRAVVAGYRGDWEEAERHAQTALDFASRGRLVVSEARLHYFWGRWLIEKGDEQGARERFGRALAIFQQLGAHPYVTRIVRMLETPVASPAVRLAPSGGSGGNVTRWM